MRLGQNAFFMFTDVFFAIIIAGLWLGRIHSPYLTKVSPLYKGMPRITLPVSQVAVAVVVGILGGIYIFKPYMSRMQTSPTGLTTSQTQTSEKNDS